MCGIPSYYLLTRLGLFTLLELWACQGLGLELFW